jgi:hypothetical protein
MSQTIRQKEGGSRLLSDFGWVLRHFSGNPPPESFSADNPLAANVSLTHSNLAARFMVHFVNPAKNVDLEENYGKKMYHAGCCHCIFRFSSVCQ